MEMTTVEHLLGVIVIVILYFAFGIAISLLLRDIFTNERKDK
jgi:hypothetical protein|tara:strand:- start:696 stop:821 length:126 start_codon:yes stop_codon:yes gene_type:complete